LNELYGGDRPNTHNDAKLDDTTEQREVEILQRQKYTAEQELYGLQDAKDRLEGALKKSDYELVKMKNRTTQLQNEIDRSEVNANTMATQLVIAQKSE